MKGLNKTGVHDWFQFPDPADEDRTFVVHIPFMMSNWNCLFGRGCPGWFGTHEEHIRPDAGCCAHGAYMNSQVELERINSYIDELTEDDLSPEGLAHVRQKGWYKYEKDGKKKGKPGYDKDNPDSIVAKTQTRNGLCVLQNSGSEGSRIGCALHHLAARTGKGDHVDVMPQVCWQVPIATRYDYDEITKTTSCTIFPWDSDVWNEADDDGTHDSWMAWNCIDAPDAYSAAEVLYKTMERELRKLMGDAGYDILVKYLEGREQNYSIPMPGTVVNGGRPLLPLIVGNRTPLRTPRTT